MEALIALHALFVLGDSTVVQIVSAVGSLGFVGGLVAFVTLGSTKRKASSEADKADVEVDELRQRLTRQVLEDVEGQLAQYRERIAEERSRAAAAAQGQAEAQAELARAQRVLAETLEQASKERHELLGQLGEIKLENALLRRKVGELESEIASLRAQLDSDHHGRRRSDDATP